MSVSESHGLGPDKGFKRDIVTVFFPPETSDLVYHSYLIIECRRPVQAGNARQLWMQWMDHVGMYALYVNHDEKVSTLIIQSIGISHISKVNSAAPSVHRPMNQPSP